mgnify:CR=1 FL=1
MTKKLTVAIRSHIDLERIKDLLDSASRGSAYWAGTGLAYESETDKALTEEGVEIQDFEGGDDLNPKIYNLNIRKIKRGLTAMAKKEPKHFADFIKEDDDQITADVFLQCCLFGEVIYG